MDNSKEFKLMLDRAIEAHPEGFEGFDKTKNVQDQLQEMIPDFLRSNGVYLDELIRFIVDDFYKLEKVKSWEQLWLAFVYKEKYHKVWNGENWIAGKVSIDRYPVVEQ